MSVLEQYVAENKGVLTLLAAFATISALFLSISSPSESLRDVQFLTLLLFFFVLVLASTQAVMWSHKNDTVMNALFSTTFLLATVEIGKLIYFDYRGHVSTYLLQPAVACVVLFGTLRIISKFNKISFDFFGGKVLAAILAPIVLYGVTVLQRGYFQFARGNTINPSLFRDVFLDTYPYLLLILSTGILLFVSDGLSKRFLLLLIAAHFLVLVFTLLTVIVPFVV